MKSRVVKRSIVLGGHKTSVSLEDNFWEGLKEIVTERRTSLTALVGQIDAQREHGNLSSAIRLFVLAHYQGLRAQQSDTRSQTIEEHVRPAGRLRRCWCVQSRRLSRD